MNECLTTPPAFPEMNEWMFNDTSAFPEMNEWMFNDTSAFPEMNEWMNV